MTVSAGPAPPLRAGGAAALMLLASCGLFGEERQPRYDHVGNVPRRYEAPFVDAPPVVDGSLDDAAWRRTPWTEEFVDAHGTGHAHPRFRTQVKMCWDEEYLYVGAWLLEPHVRASVREHDGPVLGDEAFSVYVDPDGDGEDCHELAINALGTVADRRLARPSGDGALVPAEWEAAGMQSAVHVAGTLNDSDGMDRGWSVELALPWSALAAHANKPVPPPDGDVWRLNFARTHRPARPADGAYRPAPEAAAGTWAWSPQFAVDMRLPGHWGYVTFMRP